jgi:hypothetical protein
MGTPESYLRTFTILLDHGWRYPAVSQGLLCHALCHEKFWRDELGRVGRDMQPITYARHRFPTEIVRQAVW